MFDHSTLALFMGATLVFLLTPGPAVFYIVARSIDQGRAAGFVSTLGLNTGSLVSILNPKTALFFFAFLPQFVDPSRGSVTAQILLLGGIFVVMAFMSDSFYAMLAGTLGQWLKGNVRYLRWQRYFTGSAYIALGLGAALAGSNQGK